MPKPKRKSVGKNTSATKADVENAVDELAQTTEKAFQKTHKRLDSLGSKVGSIESKVGKIDGMEDRIVDRVVRAIQADRENEIADLQAGHADELATVEGKKEASPAWKSIPRRLKTVEQDVEHIKDQLHLP